MDIDKPIEYRIGDLAAGLATMEGLSEAQARRIIEVLTELLLIALSDGQRVVLPKLGSFTPVYRSSRSGIHPRNLTPIKVPATVRIRYKPTTALKQQMRLLISSLEVKEEQPS
jgi:DNA-binding protein HU-beta